MLRWLPNLVTLGRGIAGPVVAWLLLWADAPFAAFWLFILAALTDLIDGWLAARLGSDRELGVLLDGLADKVLTLSAWAALWARGWAPPWLAALHIARTVGVAIAWRLGVRRGVVFTPNKLGQVAIAYEGTALGVLLFHGPWGVTHWPSVGVLIGATSLALSVASAAGYLLLGPRRDEAPSHEVAP